jgi:hypothetical protein
MNAFLAEVGRRLAERWLTLLVLPGILFVGTVAVGATLRHRHWNDTARLTVAGRRLAAGLAAQGSVAVGLALIATLLAAAAAGLAARGVAGAVQRLWLGLWPPPHRAPARLLIRRRQRRWLRLHERYARLVGTPGAATRDTVEAVAAARNRISVGRPSRATWMGDRIAAAEARVDGQYGIDLYAAWARLWLVVPDSSRAELRLANERLQETMALAGWGVLYLALGAWWWPAAVVGAGTVLVAWRRSRVATDGLAELIEAAVDVHGRTLAGAVGVAVGDAELSAQAGQRVTRLLRKGA